MLSYLLMHKPTYLSVILSSAWYQIYYIMHAITCSASRGERFSVCRGLQNLLCLVWAMSGMSAWVVCSRLLVVLTGGSATCV